MACDAAILAYLECHPLAVDSLRGIAVWWLKSRCDMEQVERALQGLVERDLVRRVRLADGTFVYGRPGTA